MAITPAKRRRGLQTGGLRAGGLRTGSLRTPGQEATDLLHQAAGVDKLKVGGFKKANDIDQSVREQVQQDKRLKRATNLAYRDAIRRGNRSEALNILTNAKAQGVSFGGIQAAGRDTQRAVKRQGDGFLEAQIAAGEGQGQVPQGIGQSEDPASRSQLQDASGSSFLLGGARVSGGAADTGLYQQGGTAAPKSLDASLVDRENQANFEAQARDAFPEFLGRGSVKLPSLSSRTAGSAAAGEIDGGLEEHMAGADSIEGLEKGIQDPRFPDFFKKNFRTAVDNILAGKTDNIFESTGPDMSGQAPSKRGGAPGNILEEPIPKIQGGLIPVAPHKVNPHAMTRAQKEGLTGDPFTDPRLASPFGASGRKTSRQERAEQAVPVSVPKKIKNVVDSIFTSMENLMKSA